MMTPSAPSSLAFAAPSPAFSPQLHRAATCWSAAAAGTGGVVLTQQWRSAAPCYAPLFTLPRRRHLSHLRASADSGEDEGRDLTPRRAGGTNGGVVVVQPDFRLALSMFGLGVYLANVALWTTLGVVCSVVGAFLALQTARLRYRFSDQDLDMQRVPGLDHPGQASDGAPETSPAIGPWDYRSIIHWEFWWPGFPVLAYFKETQTTEAGRRHFIPVIMDGKTMYQQMMARMGVAKTSPKPPIEEWDDLRPLSPKMIACMGVAKTSPKPPIEEWDDLRPLSPKGWSRCVYWAKQRLLALDERLQLRAKVAEVRSKIERGEWKALGGQAQDFALHAWAELQRLGKIALAKVDALLNTPSAGPPAR